MQRIGIARHPQPACCLVLIIRIGRILGANIAERVTVPAVWDAFRADGCAPILCFRPLGQLLCGLFSDEKNGDRYGAARDFKPAIRVFKKAQIHSAAVCDLPQIGFSQGRTCNGGDPGIDRRIFRCGLLRDDAAVSIAD